MSQVDHNQKSGMLKLEHANATITDSRFMTSVQKAFIIMEALRRTEHGLTLTRLSEVTGFDLSTVQRHCYTLVALGYLIKDGQKGQLHRLAPRFLDFSFAALRQDKIVRTAALHLDDAGNANPYTAWFSLLSGTNLLYVLRAKGESYMKSLFSGRHAPLYSTAGGRAVLSQLPEDHARDLLEGSDILKITPDTITDIDKIMDEVRQASIRGYATAWQETRIGEVVAASAVIDANGSPIGAIHVSAGIDRVQRDAVEHTIAPMAINIAQLINRDIRNYHD
jgi:DNA-binding IclR family transcriptional regulator